MQDTRLGNKGSKISKERDVLTSDRSSAKKEQPFQIQQYVGNNLRKRSIIRL
jgi:hypothetical protein